MLLRLSEDMDGFGCKAICDMIYDDDTQCMRCVLARARV